VEVWSDLSPPRLSFRHFDVAVMPPTP